MSHVTLKTKSEPMPTPKWVWADDPTGASPGRWESSYLKGTREWNRPILPPHESNREPLTGKGLKSPVWLMTAKDKERAEVVLALYLRSMGIETYSDFLQSGPGYAFYAYPGSPIGYPRSEVTRVACCLEKNHRYIMDERCLLNPVEYLFCVTHWNQWLRECNEKGRTLTLPDLPTWGGLEPDSAQMVPPRVAHLCLAQGWETIQGVQSGYARPHYCGLPKGHAGPVDDWYFAGPRSDHVGIGWGFTFPVNLMERCPKRIRLSKTEVVYCRRRPGHPGRCSRKVAE